MSAEQPNELPTLAEVAPGWADLTQKALYLARQEEELLAEAEALGRIDMPAIPAAPRKLQPPPQRTLSPATLAALGDLAIPEPPPPDTGNRILQLIHSSIMATRHLNGRPT